MKELLNEISYTAIDTRATNLRRGSLDGNPQSMPVVSVEGILIDTNRYWSLSHSDALPSRCMVGDIADSSGEWIALASQRQDDFYRYLAFSDYAGFAPIFYSFLPGQAVVLSSSFNGAVQGLKSLGGHTSLNLGNYLTLVTGRARTFETLIASETMANEIHILRPGEALAVENQAVTIVERQTLSPAASSSDYEHALTAAVDYTSNTISQAVTRNSEATPIITLTGGVDSRLVLALLSQTNYLNEFRVWSIDPRNSKSETQRQIFTADVEISNQIRKSLGLSWVSDWKRQKFSASLTENLARHQSYRSNYHFQFYTAKHIQIESHPIFTLRGGGGEILRGSSNARVTSNKFDEYVDAGGALDDARWAARGYLERSFLSNQLRPVAEAYLAEQLSTPNDSSLREKLDVFYKNHRNRAHFGHHRVSADKKDHILQVLSNPFMERLVELSDYDYASSSGIVLDLFKATDADLLKFPFESEAANEKLHLPGEAGFRYEKRDSWIADFDSIRSRSQAHDFQIFAEPGYRGEEFRGDVQEEGMAFIRQGFRIIEELVSPDLKRAVELQHARVLTRLDNRQIPLGKFMAIVASTTDIVAPMPLDTARHFFTTERAESRIPPKNMLHSAAKTYREIIEA